MNFFSKEKYPFYDYLISLMGLFIFLYGFFSINASSLKYSENSLNVTSKSPVTRTVDKVVLIIIDALRHDFVLPLKRQKKQNYMYFTTSSIVNNESCLVTIKTGSPTVTLPRIKALTSGSRSNYVDVILNFMSSTYEEDNFITKAVMHGFKIVFYGDDTWLKMFPNTFHRSEGTTSFFTLDYSEVDNNVTRHIDYELSRNDWDIMILHYLGLDHIGHSEGPSSPLIKTKLEEMDGIIKKISNHFKVMERRDGVQSMIIVTGDHGMKESGGHGGTTYHEVTVPLISIGNPCKILPGWPDKNIALQTDIASTMAAILGIPYPVKSVGKIIPSLFHKMSTHEMLMLLESSREHLKKFIKIADSDLESDSLKTVLFNWLNKPEREQYELKLIISKYFQCLDKYTKELSDNMSDFKNTYLIFGLTLLWISLFIFIYKLYPQFQKPHLQSEWILCVGIFIHGFSLFATSFVEEEHQTWYFLWITVCISIVLSSLNLNGTFQKKIKVALPWIFLSFGHRILRKLNQTGDKWAFIPDIKTLLNSDEGQPWLFILFLTGIILVFWCGLIEGCSQFQLIFYGLALICITCFRLSCGNIKIKFLEFYTSRGTYEIFVFWILFSLFSILSVCNKTPPYLIWILFASLLLKPHNVILLSVEVFTSKQIHSFFLNSFFWDNIAHVWLGNLFFFYQGNGNSLANVDVSPGFIGTNRYNSVYAGIMIAAHTFNGQILAFILSRYSNLTSYLKAVFSPKLLYEASSTLVLFALMAANTLFNKSHIFPKTVQLATLK